MPEPARRTTRDAVRQKVRSLIAESWQSQANLSLFLAMLVLVAFVLPSMGFGRDDTKLYSDIVFSLLLISGVAIAWGRRKIFLLAGFVGSVALAVRWMAWLTPTRALQLWADAWSLAAILVIAVVLLSQVLFREGPVTHSRIQGAVAVYILFGIGWAHAYRMAEFLHPGSFNPAGAMSNLGDWVYYSFVTLTTVGY